eukprot:6999289-Heterocapsa_arctica.AAC.1
MAIVAVGSCQSRTARRDTPGKTKCIKHPNTFGIVLCYVARFPKLVRTTRSATFHYDCVRDPSR